MKLKVSLFLFIISFASVSCQEEPASVWVFVFGPYRMELLPDWDTIDALGRDSQITNGVDTLTHEYGDSPYNLDNETTKSHIRTMTTIDGKDALIVRPKKPGEGLIGMFVEVDSVNKFSMYGTSKDESTVLYIFESIQFE